MNTNLIKSSKFMIPVLKLVQIIGVVSAIANLVMMYGISYDGGNASGELQYLLLSLIVIIFAHALQIILQSLIEIMNKTAAEEK